MKQRLLWEIWDGGLLGMLKEKSVYGTVNPPAFYHLLQPHEVRDPSPRLILT